MSLLSRMRGRSSADDSTSAIAAAEGEAANLIAQGNAKEDEGHTKEALALYELAIRTAPRLARAHLNRGNALLALGQADDALNAYDSAIANDPGYAAAHFNAGNAQLRLARPDLALEAYRTALAHKPDFVDAEVAQGRALEAAGRAEEAAASYQRALALEPRRVEAHTLLGNVLRSARDIDGALACYRRVVEIEPDAAMGYIVLGDALCAAGRHEEAVSVYRRLIAVDPGLMEAHNNLANILKVLGKHDEAIASYRRALELSPESAEVLCNLGGTLSDRGRFDEAIASLEQAREQMPDNALVHFNLGNALQNGGRVGDAVPHYRRAIEIDPQLADAFANLGNALYRLGLLHDALVSYQQALTINPRHLSATSNIGVVLKDTGRLDEAMCSFRQALQIDPDYAIAQSSLLFVNNFLADQPPQTLLRDARRYGEVIKKQALPQTSWRNVADPGRALRVGLVSGDLHSHPVGYFLEGPLAALASQEHADVELFAYANNVFNDAVTERIKGCCRGWFSALGISDKLLAERIADDRIDVLIDVSGHTAGNRLSVFAWRPAPVQATWLGYFATTGVEAIDYFIADPWTLPESDEASFTESIWRLPETRLCFTPPMERTKVGQLPALANGFITFGCFNHQSKMNDNVVALWARILAAVPDSRLFLKTRHLQEPTVAEHVVGRFGAAGISRTRLVLETQTPRADYLAAYNRVDIALDPFPYPGGTTTVEALWMGVPVLTLAGDRFLSRQGVGLLMNAGMPEWVAADPEDYVARAVAHANDLRGLTQLRHGLRQQVLSSPIFDAPRFANYFSAALRGMWQQWCREQAPHVP